MFKKTIVEALQRSSLRATPQRYAVLEYLMRSAVHATADEIFRAMSVSDPQMSRATVYNNLHTLTRAGLVREVAVEGKAIRFDANIDRHHHFVCERCGRLEDVEWFDLPVSARRSLGQRVVRDYEIVLRGLCAGCSRH